VRTALLKQRGGKKKFLKWNVHGRGLVKIDFGFGEHAIERSCENAHRDRETEKGNVCVRGREREVGGGI
jgi:hypothetical protein